MNLTSSLCVEQNCNTFTAVNSYWWFHCIIMREVCLWWNTGINIKKKKVHFILCCTLCSVLLGKCWPANMQHEYGKRYTFPTSAYHNYHGEHVHTRCWHLAHSMATLSVLFRDRLSWLEYITKLQKWQRGLDYLLKTGVRAKFYRFISNVIFSALSCTHKSISLYVPVWFCDIDEVAL